MARDLEGLIAELVVFIACGGDRGCSIQEVLDAVDQRLGILESHPRPAQASSRENEIAAQPQQISRQHATVWRWIAGRPEICVGRAREYNHLPLEGVLDVRLDTATEGIATTSLEESKPAEEDEESDSKRVPRVYATSEAQWECIAGHPEDFTRVLQLEWQLLQGVATTRTDGILQGDLCRLVNQDKRSVPKRTDVLVQKGYLTKRTTLAKRTKTSKLWLRALAPALQSDEAVPSLLELNNQATQHTLTNDLEPVPWNHQWTGQSVDFAALTTAIMTVVKQWGVIRIRDLKQKLGILGKRWHMRVLAQLCRVISAQGALRYTAATLDGRIYKDCMQFVRNLVPQDLGVIFAAGKQRQQPVEPSYDIESQDLDQEDKLTFQGIITAHLVSLPAWNLDKPLASTVVDTVVFFGATGATNPDLISLTLGPSFSRFISALTSSFATANAQPLHLAHLRMTSEHKREGKIASYRFFIVPPEQTSTEQPQGDGSQTTSAYGFSPHIAQDLEPGHLAKLAGAGKTKFGPCKTHTTSENAVEPERRTQTDPPPSVDDNRADTGTSASKPSQAVEAPSEAKLEMPNLPDVSQPQARKRRSGRVRESFGEPPQAGTNSSASLRSAQKERHVQDAATAVEVLEDHQSPSLDSRVSTKPDSGAAKRKEAQDPSADAHKHANEKTSDVAHSGPAPMPDTNGDHPNQADEGATTTKSTRGGARSQGRGRGRGGKGGSKGGGKRWICDKCGGSWKNDIGLKYHQEKAKTTCNPSYDPTLEVPKKQKKPQYGTRLDDDSRQPPIWPERERQQGRQLRNRRRRSSNAPDSGLEENLSLSDDSNFSDAGKQDGGIITGKQSARKRPERGLKKTNTPASVAIYCPDAGRTALSQAQDLATRRLPFHDTGPVIEEPSQALSPNLPILSNASRESPPTSVQPTSATGSHMRSPAYAVTTATVPEPATPTARMALPLESDTASAQKLARSDIVKHIATLMDTFLQSEQMALPGGDAIVHIIHWTWSHDLPHLREVTPKECQSALRQLVKKNAFVEHWHAFRNKLGSFSKCSIFTRPGLDPLSAPCLDLVEKIKAVHPRPYIPEEFEHVAEALGGRTRRRTLASGVAVLDAPVYAAQVAVKRAANENDEAKSPRRRKRRKGLIRDDVNELARETDPGRMATVEGIQLVHNLPYGSAFTGHGRAPSEVWSDLRFLEPNTFLEDEGPELLDEDGPTAVTVPASLHGEFPGTNPEDVTPAEHVFVESTLVIQGGLGKWPTLDAQDFEDDSMSFAMNGWLPDAAWHFWSSQATQLAKPPRPLPGKHSQVVQGDYDRFRRHVHRVERFEVSRAEHFVRSPASAAGPNNIFVPLAGPSPQVDTSDGHPLRWVDDQLDNDAAATVEYPEAQTSDSNDELPNVDPRLKAAYQDLTNRQSASNANSHGVKRVLLTTRTLTAVPLSSDAERQNLAEVDDREALVDRIEDEDEVVAAIVAVRALLGGIDQGIDWGILARLFPHIGVDGLQSFWEEYSIEHARYIASYTQDFHDNFIPAYEKGELPTIDFEDLSSYDWDALINWTMAVAEESMNGIPADKVTLKANFEMEVTPSQQTDWRNEFFHIQSSIFSRFEWAVSEPGAVSLKTFGDSISDNITVTDMVVIRSWVRSLCCSPQDRFAAHEIKDKFLSLPGAEPQAASALLGQAIEDLTEERVIRRSSKLPLHGRPYQLAESFNANLQKLGHEEKYLQAAACKARMDAVFRSGATFPISYALGDGATMAITSLNAAKRIILRPVELPDVPFGFEPGNYESRKYPKKYYHFELEAVPTKTYLFDDDIDVLQEVIRRGPPLGSPRGELPQWVDFAGAVDYGRWSSIVAAFCFALATRGPMSIEALCGALDPVLEPCEAAMIIRWGKDTGALKSLISGVGTTVGEWWWLAVPYMINHGQDVGVPMNDGSPESPESSGPV